MVRKLLAAIVLAVLLGGVPALADNFLLIPFFNTSKDSSLDWIGESLSETVREALAGENIIALNRDDREEAYHRLSLRRNVQLTRATVLRIGELLDADQVIFGSFDFLPPEGALPRTRGTLRIKAQIINLRKANRGPEYSELGSLEDLARLQTHLAWQTLKFVLGDKAPSEEAFRQRRPVVRVEAIESYTRGLLAPTAEQKLKLFSQAVRIDPLFSQANFELGRLNLARKNYRGAADHFVRVTNTDGHYREATFFLGVSRFYLGDYAAAEQSFRSVAEVVPLNEVWNNLGAAQSRLNSPAALQNFQKALEGDPADPDYHFNVGYALFKQGELEKAAERFRAVLDRDPDDAEAITMLGRALRKPVAQPSGPQKTESPERLKETFEESAYLQLKAIFEPRKD